MRKFGVPFWALARAFGRDPMRWYRLEIGLGRNSLVGTTVRSAELREHLLADERHRRRDGEKSYIATTVGDGCLLGAALSEGAGVVSAAATLNDILQSSVLYCQVARTCAKEKACGHHSQAFE